MELGFLVLVALTIIPSTGFSLPTSRPSLPPSTSSSSSSGLRFPSFQESTGKGSKVKAGEPLSPRGSSLEKVTDSGEAHRRAKRCTCFTYKDKECVYYCHLDIIWINTPERTVPYGLANYRGGFRGRRSTGQHRKSVHPSEWAPSRCACTDRCDEPCMRFCTMTQSGQCNTKEELNSTTESSPSRKGGHSPSVAQENLAAST